MLTARERDVLVLLAHGYRYTEIAVRLGISAHTVGTARALALKLISLRDLARS
jgi:DNA-binding CsgD family transcriptional regulator